MTNIGIMGIVFCQPSGRLNKCHIAKNGQLALLFQIFSRPFVNAPCQNIRRKLETENQKIIRAPQKVKKNRTNPESWKSSQAPTRSNVCCLKLCCQ